MFIISQDFLGGTLVPLIGLIQRTAIVNYQSSTNQIFYYERFEVELANSTNATTYTSLTII